jgi:hypothetical protein
MMILVVVNLFLLRLNHFKFSSEFILTERNESHDEFL